MLLAPDGVVVCGDDHPSSFAHFFFFISSAVIAAGVFRFTTTALSEKMGLQASTLSVEAE